MDESGGLECVVGPLVSHFALGQVAQLFIDEREQTVGGRFSAVVEVGQELGCVGDLSHLSPRLVSCDRIQRGPSYLTLPLLPIAAIGRLEVVRAVFRSANGEIVVFIALSEPKSHVRGG